MLHMGGAAAPLTPARTSGGAQPGRTGRRKAPRSQSPARGTSSRAHPVLGPGALQHWVADDDIAMATPDAGRLRLRAARSPGRHARHTRGRGTHRGSRRWLRHVCHDAPNTRGRVHRDEAAPAQPLHQPQLPLSPRPSSPPVPDRAEQRTGHRRPRPRMRGPRCSTTCWARSGRPGRRNDAALWSPPRGSCSGPSQRCPPAQLLLTRSR